MMHLNRTKYICIFIYNSSSKKKIVILPCEYVAVKNTMNAIGRLWCSH